jgi:hypothetical protein
MPPKGRGFLRIVCAYFVENVENLRDIIEILSSDNENLGGSPGLGRGTVLENITDDFLGGTFGQLDAAPRMNRACVGLEENRWRNP